MSTVAATATDLLGHISPTLTTAAIGYLGGNALGYLVALIFTRRPLLRRLLWPIMTLAFVTPLIMLAPILGTVYGQKVGGILLVGLSVYYSTTMLVLSAINSLDEGLERVVLSAGGTEKQVRDKVWVPASVPALFAGLRAGIPVALLAGVISDMFGAGRGLGVRLVTLMQSADAVGLIVFCILCSSLAWLSFLLVRCVELLLPRRFRQTLTPAQSLLKSERHGVRLTLGRRSADSLAAVLVGLVLWELLARAIDVRIYFRGPVDLIGYAVQKPRAFWDVLLWKSLLTAGRALTGVIAAMIVAVLCAVTSYLCPRLRPVIILPVLVTQTVPLVALVPLIVALLGKGSVAVVMVTFAATFFFMFNAVEGGLRSTPTTYKLMTRLYGAGALRFVWTFALPNAKSYIVAGIALTVPRMMGGAILAEYLISADGLGGLVYKHRAHDFGVLWILGLISGIAGIQMGLQIHKLAQRFWSDVTRVGISDLPAKPHFSPK
jgi:ABC-type nitrate/sulfonate/bicarbonate transport system permease component